MIDFVIRPDYSAEIGLRLEANGESWPLAKLGPDCFVPAKPMQIDPCNAEIVLTVDGEERRWNVRLVDGAFPFDYSIRILYDKS